jgi:hypothetical protein
MYKQSIRVAIMAVLCLLFWVCMVQAQTLKGGGVSLDDQRAASKALQTLMEAKGLDGLLALTDSPDLMVSFHAAWEQGKGDKKRIEAIIVRFENSLKMTPPEWWQDRLKAVVIYAHCHYVPEVDSSRLKKNSQIANERFDVVTNPGGAGFGYTVQVTDGKTKKMLWKRAVWAVGRTALAGEGVHQIELVISKDRLFVFGAESHGVYAEVFKLEDGTPLVRFCTCYWFNFSECWKLK